MSDWLLDPGVIHLNHGSFGACPRAVLDHQQRLRHELERNPVGFLAHELEPRLDDARRVLADFIGADPAGVAFVANATAGVAAVVGSLHLDRGDEIVLTDHGYHACATIVAAAAARTGARIRVASIPFAGVTPDLTAEAVLAAVTDRTRLVVVDHVTSPTALVLPVRRIAAEVEHRGIAVLVDGAHAPGMLALDVAAIGASYYVGNCHKWMCAPKGAGFLWAAPSVRDGLLPTVVSHGYDSRRTDRSRYHQMFDWIGTDDPTAWLSVPAAIATVGAMAPGGWDEVRRLNHDLVMAGRTIVADAIGATGLPDMIGSMAAIPLAPAPRDDRDHDLLAMALRERHRIEVPVPAWPAAPQRVLRISAQRYNTIADYERLAAALRLEGVAVG